MMPDIPWLQRKIRERYGSADDRYTREALTMFIESVEAYANTEDPRDIYDAVFFATFAVEGWSS